jgi:hypothetical protein
MLLFFCCKNELAEIKERVIQEGSCVTVGGAKE